MIFSKQPNTTNIYCNFNLSEYNYEIDFIHKVKYDKAGKHEKELLNYFMSFKCNEHLKTSINSNDKRFEKYTISNIKNAKNKYELIELCGDDSRKISTAIKAYDILTSLEKAKKQQEEGNKLKLLE